MLCFLFDKFGANANNYVSQSAMNDDIVFSQFSRQWLGFIVIICVSPLFLIKKMDLILKLAHGGINLFFSLFFTHNQIIKKPFFFYLFPTSLTLFIKYRIFRNWTLCMFHYLHIFLKHWFRKTIR